jgi:hypothetical protein
MNRGRGKPENTLSRELETDIKRTGMSWKDLENRYVMEVLREQVCHGMI